MDREHALQIMDRLTSLDVNVVLVAIADPTYGAVAGTSEEPNYQIELSRNNALTGDKITQMISEVAELDSQIEFPNMNVFTNEEIAARTPVLPSEPTPEPAVPIPTDESGNPIEPTPPEDPVPAPVEASPTTDDVVASGHDDPRDTE